MYIIQFRDANRRWKEPRIDAHHQTIAKAIARVELCDEDGYFGPNARILKPGHIFVWGDKEWRKLREIVGVVVKNGDLEDRLEYDVRMLCDMYGISEVDAEALQYMFKDQANA